MCDKTICEDGLFVDLDCENAIKSQTNKTEGEVQC